MSPVMTPEQFHTWSQQLQLPLETEALITAIRGSSPVRRVRGRTNNQPVEECFNEAQQYRTVHCFIRVEECEHIGEEQGRYSEKDESTTQKQPKRSHTWPLLGRDNVPSRVV
jgi:hypothetical protein